MGKKMLHSLKPETIDFSYKAQSLWKCKTALKKYKQFIHKQVTFTGQAQNTFCMEDILQGA